VNHQNGELAINLPNERHHRLFSSSNFLPDVAEEASPMTLGTAAS
jgi:hypothetical protein